MTAYEHLNYLLQQALENDYDAIKVDVEELASVLRKIKENGYD